MHSEDTGYRSISPAEAQALVEAGAVLALDVRTPGEYAGLGHIPDAWLVPVDLIASAPAVLPRDGRPVLVYCEHGIRSAAACRWLAKAGVSSILDMAGGLSRWTGPRAFGDGPVCGPSSWLLQNADLLAAGARVLDVAAGRGRHALLLAAAGLHVTAVDRDGAALAELADTAARAGLSIVTGTRDLEQEGEVDLGDARFDLVLVFNYLHRPLFPALLCALAPGGLLFYETFLAGQAERGHPKNPAFLLEPGELVARVAPLMVLRSREGEHDGKLVASVVARRVNRGTGHLPRFVRFSDRGQTSVPEGIGRDQLTLGAPARIARVDTVAVWGDRMPHGTSPPPCAPSLQADYRPFVATMSALTSARRALRLA